MTSDRWIWLMCLTILRTMTTYGTCFAAWMLSPVCLCEDSAEQEGQEGGWAIPGYRERWGILNRWTKDTNSSEGLSSSAGGQGHLHFHFGKYECEVQLGGEVSQDTAGICTCYFIANNTRYFVDILQRIVASYNATHHPSLGMSPIRRLTLRKCGAIFTRLRLSNDLVGGGYICNLAIKYASAGQKDIYLTKHFVGHTCWPIPIWRLSWLHTNAMARHIFFLNFNW